MTLSRASTLLVFSLGLAVVSCSEDKSPPVADSPQISLPEAVTPPVPELNKGWSAEEAGDVILLSRPEDMATVSIVLPDFTDTMLGTATQFRLDSLSRMGVDLFGPAGLVASSNLLARNQTPIKEGCLGWPSGTLSPVPQTTWRAGFHKGVARGIPLDSIENMSSADSLSVTTELARLSSLVVEGSDAAFRGLPFTVRRAYRFSLGTTSVLVGDVVRKINEEANPREEHLLIVAERKAGADQIYSAVFESRVAGKEDVVRTNEILGAVNFTKGKPALIVSFEYEDGGKVALLERIGPSQWKIKWQSAYTGC